MEFCTSCLGFVLLLQKLKQMVRLKILWKIENVLNVKNHV